MSILQANGAGLGGAGDPGGALAGGGILGSHAIDQSLRFNDGDSAYLNRTPSSDGDRQIFTYSVWFKVANTGLTYSTLFSVNDRSAGNYNFIRLDSDALRIQISGGGSNYAIQTNQVFRDVSSWYHLVLSVDTTQATSTDRVKIYINGEQVTSFSSASYPSLNLVTDVNSNTEHRIGSFVDFGRYFDGYMAEINMIDGTALDATSFGETINGIWVPKAYDTADGAYDTNGFYLSFADSAAIGDDLSGNTNDFTANNLAASDVMSGESPTNNFPTMNSLQEKGNAQSLYNLSEGNLKMDTGASNYAQMSGTMGVQSGKWYTETYINSEGYPSWYIGWIARDSLTTMTGGNDFEGVTTGFGYFTGSNVLILDFGETNNSSSSVAYSGLWSGARAPTTGDIIGCAVDFDNRKVWWSINGEWVDVGSGAGDPANGTNPSSTYTSSDIADDDYKFAWQAGWGQNANTTKTINFGQDSTFAGATTAGGNADENGYGDFKYAVPSGFLAMCSANLPEPAIGPNSDTTSDQNFNTVLYTGTGATQSITGVGFQPDWVFVKRRAGVQEPSVTDSVRGVNAQLRPASTAAESAQTDALTSFDADGFTLGADATNRSYNYYTDAHVAWNWKAGGTAVLNEDGTIDSQVSANQDAGFSIVTWVGNNTDGATVGHGLTDPEFSIVKNRDSGTNWDVCWSGFTSGTSLNLDTTAAEFSPTTGYQQLGTSTITLKNGGVGIGRVNGTPDDYVAYVFKSVPGYSKVDTYVGNGSADGPFVYTGFRPAWVMTKMSTNGSQWTIIDNTRNTYNAVDKGLVANTSAAEVTGSSSLTPFVDFTSNGFKIRSSQAQMNQNGDTFIYLAFAEAPFKYANAR